MKTVICPKCGKVITVTKDNYFTICCDEIIYILTDRDRDIFFNELNNPSEPNEALKNAASRYKKLK
jgi:uncharacterized protein (DUF1778 family)